MFSQNEEIFANTHWPSYKNPSLCTKKRYFSVSDTKISIKKKNPKSEIVTTTKFLDGHLLNG